MPVAWIMVHDTQHIGIIIIILPITWEKEYSVYDQMSAVSHT